MTPAFRMFTPPPWPFREFKDILSRDGEEAAQRFIDGLSISQQEMLIGQLIADDIDTAQQESMAIFRKHIEEHIIKLGFSKD